ncbi:hypothetical protein BLNAU_3590 [Blattamonas nauphoetae]|uniref:Uncharacterized protein n=1 Tax=Blattamonas nauphoetae TaxID=2049346 RepID=A0ABQ9YCI4_9EUKA|nr:hypothetical protein BLNAU_3590 [Blattamonas nauphoetae]
MDDDNDQFPAPKTAAVDWNVVESVGVDTLLNSDEQDIGDFVNLFKTFYVEPSDASATGENLIHLFNITQALMEFMNFLRADQVEQFNEIRQMRIQSDSAGKRMQKLQEENKQLKAATNKMSSQITELQTKNTNLLAQLNDNMADMQRMGDALSDAAGVKTNLEKQSDSIKQLTEDVQRLQRINKRNQETIKAKDVEIKTLKEKVEDEKILREEREKMLFSNVEENLNKLMDEISVKDRRIIGKTNENQKLKRELDVLRQEVSEYQAEAYPQKLKQMQDQNARLKARLNRVQTNLKHSEAVRENMSLLTTPMHNPNLMDSQMLNTTAMLDDYVKDTAGIAEEERDEWRQKEREWEEAKKDLEKSIEIELQRHEQDQLEIMQLRTKVVRLERGEYGLRECEHEKEELLIVLDEKQNEIMQLLQDLRQLREKLTQTSAERDELWAHAETTSEGQALIDELLEKRHNLGLEENEAEVKEIRTVSYMEGQNLRSLVHQLEGEIGDLEEENHNLRIKLRAQAILRGEQAQHEHIDERVLAAMELAIEEVLRAYGATRLLKPGQSFFTMSAPQPPPTQIEVTTTKTTSSVHSEDSDGSSPREGDEEDHLPDAFEADPPDLSFLMHGAYSGVFESGPTRVAPSEREEKLKREINRQRKKIKNMEKEMQSRELMKRTRKGRQVVVAVPEEEHWREEKTKAMREEKPETMREARSPQDH